MTREEAFLRAAKNYEVHNIAAETWSSSLLASGERKRAEICKIIIDIMWGKTPTGNVGEALSVLKKEEAEYKLKLAYSMAESIYPRYTEEYKNCVDWYGHCVKALEDYLVNHGGENK